MRCLSRDFFGGEDSLAGSTRNSKVILAARETLYRAFLDPEALTIWLPPGEMTGEIYSSDARVGGGYRMSLFYPVPEAASQKVFRGKTTDREDSLTSRFVELDPPNKIVQAVTFNSSDPAFWGR
jgi:uncharacterized protein YndB with AHSA1/START domain